MPSTTQEKRVYDAYTLCVIPYDLELATIPLAPLHMDRDALLRQEQAFLLGEGVLVGMAKHLRSDDRDQVHIEAMSEEAITTSEIEGEMLNRASVQSSIQRQLGLTTNSQRVPPKEQGVSELMVSLYSTVDQPLSAEVLFEWHRMVMAGRSDVGAVGSFRPSAEP